MNGNELGKYDAYEAPLDAVRLDHDEGALHCGDCKRALAPCLGVLVWFSSAPSEETLDGGPLSHI